MSRNNHRKTYNNAWKLKEAGAISPAKANTSALERRSMSRADYDAQLHILQVELAKAPLDYEDIIYFTSTD